MTRFHQRLAKGKAEGCAPTDGRSGYVPMLERHSACRPGVKCAKRETSLWRTSVPSRSIDRIAVGGIGTFTTHGTFLESDERSFYHASHARARSFRHTGSFLVSARLCAALSFGRNKPLPRLRPAPLDHRPDDGTVRAAIPRFLSMKCMAWVTRRASSMDVRKRTRTPFSTALCLRTSPGFVDEDQAAATPSTSTMSSPICQPFILTRFST